MATELASVIQSAHLNPAPSAAHDINPSTATSARIPALLQDPSPPRSQSTRSSRSQSPSPVRSDVLRPLPRSRQRQRMPLPDLRFEQTYLASIAAASTRAQVLYITVRDQVVMPLVQGVGYHLIVAGWRFVNRGTAFRGSSVGARVRRWWWSVNGWKVPEGASRKGGGVQLDEYLGTVAGSGGD